MKTKWKINSPLHGFIDMALVDLLVDKLLSHRRSAQCSKLVDEWPLSKHRDR